MVMVKIGSRSKTNLREDKAMKDDNNELNIDQLDGVAGGTSPVLPKIVYRSKPLPKGSHMKKVLGTMRDSIEETGKVPFTECPNCHSQAVRYNEVEKICTCQDCGYLETYEND